MGEPLAQLNVQTIDEESLHPTHPHPPAVLPLTGSDFALSSDGNGGTLVTYYPPGYNFFGAIDARTADRAHR